MTPAEDERTGRAAAASPPDPAAGALLALNNVEVIYDEVILVLRGLSLHVGEGEVVALLGSNGAGKSTTLKAISGLLPSEDGEITDGEIAYAGRRIDHLDAAAVVRLGICQVMEGRRVFEHLTVEENLRAGAYTRRGDGSLADDLELVFGYFAPLAQRRRQDAGYLSGGEQQMLAMGRALMASPRLLLLDEPSLGLAPKLVEQIADIIVDINRQGTSVLLVEQNATMALSVAQSGYVMETGRIVKEGKSAELLADQDIQEFYLGMGESGRRSFRDVKTYRRKKRWSA